MHNRAAALLMALGVAIAFSVASGPFRTGTPEAVARADEAQPTLLLSALWSDDAVRYSVTLVRPDGVSLRDLRVEIDLPSDAEFLDALETPNRTTFLGRQADTLAWTASDLPAGSPADAFTFVLASSLSDALVVRASWAGPTPGRIETSAIPDVARAGAGEGVALLTTPAEGGLLPVGDSGVLVGATSGAPFPEGVAVRIGRLGPADDPPAALGDFWWCAAVEIEGLPEGAAVLVLVPARRPLPPDAEVRLFERRGETWVDPGERAAVTMDGQYVVFAHRGGVLAAGIQPPLQPRPVLTVTTIVRPTATRPPTRLTTIVDGTSNTLIVGETTAISATPGTRPTSTQAPTSTRTPTVTPTRTVTPTPTPKPTLDLKISHAVPPTVAPDLTLTYTTVVEALVGSQNGTNVVIILPSQVADVNADGPGWTCSVAGPTVSCGRTDPIDARRAYPPITTSVRVTSCAQSMPSVANLTSADDVASNNTSSGTTTRICSGVTTDLTSDGSTGLFVGASHGFNAVLNASQATDQDFTWSVSSGANGTITPFSIAGSSCSLDAASVVLTCQRTQSVPTGATSLGTVLIRPSSCVQPLNLQLQLQETLALDVQGANPLSRSFTVACGPAELSINASVSPSPLLSGQPATWTINLQNTGESRTAGQITLVATLPVRSFVGSAALQVPFTFSGTGWSCTAISRSVPAFSVPPGAVPPGSSLLENTVEDVTCTRTGSVAAGASAPPLTISTTVGSAFCGAVGFDATAQGGGALASDAATLDTDVRCAELSVTLMSDFNTVEAGQTQTLFATVRNAASAAPAPGTYIVRVVPAAGEGALNVTGSGWNCPGGSGASAPIDCFAPGVLAPGSPQSTLFITYATRTCTVGSPSSRTANVSVQVRGGNSPQAAANHTTTVTCP